MESALVRITGSKVSRASRLRSESVRDSEVDDELPG